MTTADDTDAGEQLALLSSGPRVRRPRRLAGDDPTTDALPVAVVQVDTGLPHLDLILVIGQYAQAWHLGRSKGGLTETVRGWRAVLDAPRRPRVLPLPHPSWRNSGWLKANPWFEVKLLPVLRAEVAAAMAPR